MVLRLLHIAMVTVWALFLGWLLSFGRDDLMRLIHPRLWWILGVGVVVLCLFLISLVKSLPKAPGAKSAFLELPSLLVLLVPLAFFMLAKDARLGGVAAENRFAKTEDGMYVNTIPPAELLEETETDSLSFSKVVRQPEAYVDRDVSIVCQSYSSEKLPENTMMCYRYLITCCAADALPVFIFLTDLDGRQIDLHQWIEVKGPLSIEEKFGKEFPTVKLDSFEYVEEPDFPWAL